MRTWLQPVQFATGPAGKPRRTHVRRVELEETVTPGRPRVVSVSPRTLCGRNRVVPVQGKVTCPQCLRLAEPFWTKLTGDEYAALVREKEETS